MGRPGCPAAADAVTALLSDPTATRRLALSARGDAMRRLSPLAVGLSYRAFLDKHL